MRNQLGGSAAQYTIQSTWGNKVTFDLWRDDYQTQAMQNLELNDIWIRPERSGRPWRDVLLTDVRYFEVPEGVVHVRQSFWAFRM